MGVDKLLDWERVSSDASPVKAKKKRAAPKREEEALQTACMGYWRRRFRPNNDEYWLCYKVHNEGKKGLKRAMQDKAAGILAGAADLNIDIAAHGFHGLRVEFKVGAGKQSEAQKRFESAQGQAGYCYRVVRSLDEFVDLVCWWLGFS